MAGETEDLVLADEVNVGEGPVPCYIEECGETGWVVVGKDGELEYCPEHATQMALELLELPMVKEALIRQAKVVLDEPQAVHLRMLAETSGHVPVPVQAYRDELVDVLTAGLAAISAARRPDP